MARIAISVGGLALEMEDEDMDLKDVVKLSEQTVKNLIKKFGVDRDGD